MKTILKRKGRTMRGRIFLFSFMTVFFLLSGHAWAHRVNLFAYVENGKVYTESYFSDGRPVEGGKVLVYDSRNKLLVEGVTDKEGVFNFDVPKVDDLTIVLEATMGHKADFKLKKTEVEAGK